jgi:TrmH family RNA methyltransferase
VLAEAKSAGVEFDVIVVREGDKLSLPALRGGRPREAPPGRGAQTRYSPRIVTLAPGAYRAATQTVTPQGVMAIARVHEASAAEAIAAARANGWPLVVLDRIQDPGNVGAICRTAAAAGAPALAVLEGSADPFGAKAVRASAGNVFRLVVARAAWSDLQGLDGYGGAARGGATLAEAAVENAGMLVFGSEAHGLSRGDLSLVTVPIQSGVESLNVAAAAAVILFEVARRKAA